MALGGGGRRISNAPKKGPIRKPGVMKTPASKAHLKMIQNGRTKVKETQNSAYNPEMHGDLKKMLYNASSGGTQHAAKKLMTENRALTYGGEAAMKTRL